MQHPQTRELHTLEVSFGSWFWSKVMGLRLVIALLTESWWHRVSHGKGQRACACVYSGLFLFLYSHSIKSRGSALMALSYLSHLPKASSDWMHPSSTRPEVEIKLQHEFRDGQNTLRLQRLSSSQLALLMQGGTFLPEALGWGCAVLCLNPCKGT